MPTIKKIRNWKEYNKSLEKRGELIFHFSEEYLSGLYFKGGQKRGGKKIYSPLMFEYILVARVVLKLSLRASIGFARGLLLRAYGIEDARIPNFGHASREIKKLQLRIKSDVKCDSNISISFDSTGISITNASGWHQHKYGNKDYKYGDKWRKLHISVDLESGQILSSELTASNVNDCEAVPDLMAGISEFQDNIVSVSADKAYSTSNIYTMLNKRGIKAVIPVKRTAKMQNELKEKPKELNKHLIDRDNIIKFIRQYDDFESGIKVWKEFTGYHNRSRIEATMFRYKNAFGNAFIFKNESSRSKETIVKINVLNKMMALGKANYAT